MVAEEVPEEVCGEVLAQAFEEVLDEGFGQHRPRLLAMAHRMLGSRAEAEDAVQETWLRLSRSSPAAANAAVARSRAPGRSRRAAQGRHTPG